jgi:iron complex transport system substrate-binding protein
VPKSIFKLTLLLLGLLFFAGLFTPVNAVTVTDSRAKRISVDKPLRRIVSLAPYITETLTYIGLEHRIVGLIANETLKTTEKTLPIVGNYESLGLETIVRLSPDLVVAWLSGNKKTDVKQLEHLGIKVYAHSPRSIHDISKLIRDLSVLAGKSENALEYKETFVRDIKVLKDTYSKGKKVTVFYQVWREPLLTLNENHLITDLISLCGGRNIFSDAAAAVPQVSVETVIRAQPEAIISSVDDNTFKETLAHWQQWPMIPAAKMEQIYNIPPSELQTFSPKILKGARKLCQILETVRNN